MTKERHIIQAVTNERFIRIFREGFEDGWADGYVAGVGAEFFALELIDKSIRFDALTACGTPT